MSRAKVERNRKLRETRARGMSLRRLARRFGINLAQVQRILATTGGDPLAFELDDLARAPEADLVRERERLQDRIRSDRRRLRFVSEELEARRTNRILGLTG